MTLRFKCYVNGNTDNNRFVGIKIINNQAKIYFPLGYRLSNEERNIKEDILKLISVLTKFMTSSNKISIIQNLKLRQNENFPITAYINVIKYYLKNSSYYVEKDVIQKYNDRGKFNFRVSLRKNVRFFQEDGSPYFNRYIVKKTILSENNLITMIHKYCVYESFIKMGWLFTSYIPPNPHIKKNIPFFISVLKKYLAISYLEEDIILFKEMISILEYLKGKKNDDIYYFGTERFEYIWEKLIDTAFGIKEKEKYFPRTTWYLKYGNIHQNCALEPDTIMIYDKKIYVIDAKYYKYGITGIASHLPESTSINKQITYGEYVYNNSLLKNMCGDNMLVFNAFLIPYNKDNNPFGIDKHFAYIGEANSDWKDNTYNYERVQGILIDTRFLINNYDSFHMNNIRDLANVIENTLK